MLTRFFHPADLKGRGFLMHWISSVFDGSRFLRLVDLPLPDEPSISAAMLIVSLFSEV
jgi:hypothetical protein